MYIRLPLWFKRPEELHQCSILGLLYIGIPHAERYNRSDDGPLECKAIVTPGVT